MPLFGSKSEYALSLRSRDAATTARSIVQRTSSLNFVPWVIYSCPTPHEDLSRLSFTRAGAPKERYGPAHLQGA
jgi:hypothetical protein